MDKLTPPPHNFLALEDFYLHNETVTAAFLGWRGAQAAWALKDMDPLSQETEDVCRRLQNAIREKVGSRPAQWIIDVEESDMMIDHDAWVEHSLAKAALARPESCGYPDLDLNIETQVNCGTQLEEFHRGTWAQERLAAMFEVARFEPLDPLVCHFEHPLPDLIAKLDKDLSIGVGGGMRHPYNCSVAVGALSLRLLPHEGRPEETIAITRRIKVSEVGAVVRRLKDEITERHPGLTNAIREQQESLRCLPDGWPNEKVSEEMKTWATMRFLGDAGLMGSEFFEGDWLMTQMPTDVQRRVESVAAAVQPEAKSWAQLRQSAASSDSPASAGTRVEASDALANLKERAQARREAKPKSEIRPKRGVKNA